jgi:hypothetical protein
MKRNSYHRSGAWNFELGHRFFVNLCTVAIQNAKTLFYSSTTTGEDEESARPLKYSPEISSLIWLCSVISTIYFGGRKNTCTR